MAETLRFTVIGHGDAEGIERLARSIDDLVDRIRRLDRANADPEIDIDTRRAERKIGQFARNLRRKIREAVSALPDIELNADSSDAQREIAQIRAELIALRDANIGIDLDATEAERRMSELRTRLAALSADSANIQVKADTAAAAAALRVVKEQADRLDGRRIQLHVSIARGFNATIGRLARFGNQLRGLAVATAAIGAIGAGPQIIGIGSAVLQLAGALALIPAGTLAAAAGIGTLVLGFQHLGDALGPADTPAHIKKVDRALAALTPSARELALTLRDLAFSGGFKALQLDVQERLFRGVGQEVRNLAGNYLPSLRSMLGGIADGYNRATVSSAQFLSQQPVVQKLSTAFDQVRQSVNNASGAARPLTEAVVSLVSVGASRLPQLGQMVTNVANRFRDWVTQAERSGDLAAMIDRGISAIQQLGRIAINVGSSLGALFRAADTAGVDFLGTVEQITAKIREFLNSAQGQQTVVNLFRAIRETVDAAMPGIKAIGQALIDIISRLSNSGVLTGIAATFSAIAQAALPMVGVLTNLAAAVLPPLLAAMRALAPVLVPVAVGLLAVSTAARGLAVLQGLGSRFTGFAGKVAAASGGIGKFKVAMTGLAGFLGAGGPWGLAIAAAVVGIGLLVGAWADSQAKADEMKAKIDALAGSLNTYTGAATEATRAQVAQELGTSKLSDGTTSYAQALTAAGVSTRDFVDATTGNEQALQKVRTQLDASVASLIKSSPAYANNVQQITAMGISLQDLAAAAQGNAPAMDRINSAIARSSAGSLEAQASNQLLVDSLLKAGGASAEMGQRLNEMAGQYSAAAQQARDAGAANLVFGDVLDTIKVGFAGLANAAPITGKMAQGLRDLGDAANIAATQAGKSAAEWGGVAAGGQAAATSMQQSRQAFIDAAVAAGVAAPAAEELANQVLGMPSAAQIIFETNATGVQAEMISLNERIKQIPPNKSITVTDLSDAARANLQTLGFTIEAIPGTKDVKVTAPTAEAQASLNAFVALANGTTVTLTGDMNVNPATGKISQTVQLGNGQTAVMTYDARPDPATGKINATVDFGNGQTATMQLDSDPSSARSDIDATVAYGNGKTSTIKVRQTGAEAANAAIDHAGRARTAVIHVTYLNAHRALGAYTRPRAEGAYATPYASGGLRKMSASRAEIVPPNQPRVIGDRQVNDEAFIPINNAPRSQAILQTTASRMGFDLVPNDGRTAVASAVGPARRSGGSDGAVFSAILTELRALRGDVDHHGDNASISARLDLANRLLARLGRMSAAAEAQGLRVTSELGSF